MQINTVKIKDGDSFRIINESDFKHDQHVLHGDSKLSTKPLTVDVQVGITPELQKIIDDTKAECEKVTAENTALNDQVNNLTQLLEAANARIAELESAEQVPAPKKPTAAEIKAAKASEAAKVAEQAQE